MVCPPGNGSSISHQTQSSENHRLKFVPFSERYVSFQGDVHVVLCLVYQSLVDESQVKILLMEGILHHLGCKEPCK